jgi:hypothetical protein
MLALQDRFYPFWDYFWDERQQAECPWARQMSDDAQHDFEQTLESMLKASIPDAGMDRLRTLWSDLRLDQPLSDPDFWWNFSCTLERSGSSPATAEDAKSVLDELSASQERYTPDQPVSPEVIKAATLFLQELKYTALCTLWSFTCEWSCFTITLPRDVIDFVRKDLFNLTMLILVRELK